MFGRQLGAEALQCRETVEHRALRIELARKQELSEMAVTACICGIHLEQIHRREFRFLLFDFVVVKTFHSKTPRRVLI